MKKLKIERRIENAFDAFFEANVESDANDLVFAGDSTVLRNEEQADLTDKAEFRVNIARQLLWFLPGAFLLYFATLSSIFFFPLHGLTLQMAFWFLAGGFLCVAGLGSLKKPKNLLIPLAIVLFSAFVAALFALFPDSWQPTLYFDYSIYLFPAALIISKLLQNWIDSK
ncbi:MAG: hypothetical protein ACR2HG_15315 [Pyrinomonadaceae bacterium]